MRTPSDGSRRDDWRRGRWRAAGALALAGLWTVLSAAGCGGPESAGDGTEDVEAGSPDAAVVATDEDWEVVRRTVEWGRSEGLDTLPFGRAVARVGLRFVGTPYEPGTLEVEGPERLVVNLRALDCVTFVETALALTHVIRGGAPADGELRDDYRRILTRLRYRDGRLDGYPSRLHYFSEWIRDGERKGLLRELTGDLGGVPDPEPVDFMSTHPDAYRQLADPDVLEAVRRTEERLSRRSLVYVPQDSIAAVAGEIRDGDVIAATSATEGLDVAHTGLAVRREGRLHLLHAPLVGDSVEVSELPLADRIRGIDGQDGILVARPLDPAADRDPPPRSER